MSLQEFIKTNHHQLVALTRGKVAKRNPTMRSPGSDMTHGVHVFLRQLEGALVDETKRDPLHRAHAEPPTDPHIVNTATLNGRELLELGASVHEVVHRYGDVCQAVTELAVELDARISVADFHTLNRCLDNAIAAAVTAWTEPPRTLVRTESTSLRDLLGSALMIFSMLRDGKISTAGPSVAMLGRQLSQMRHILDGESPETFPKG
jgi:hypothetical protein